MFGFNLEAARNGWQAGMAFVNRFEADYETMCAGEDDGMQEELRDAANTMVELVNNLAYNGGLESHWGTPTAKGSKARAAAARIILRAALELTAALEGEEGVEVDDKRTVISDARFDDNGRPTESYLKQCHAALFDVSEFVQRAAKGEEMVYVHELTVESRRAFLLAPNALSVARNLFDATLLELERQARQELDTINGPLPPEPTEEEEEGGEAETS